MNSIGKDCQQLKDTYDVCFNQWFSEKFLKGQTQDTCGPLFKNYQECVKRAIKEKQIDLWEIDKDVLGTEKDKFIGQQKKKG